MAKNKTRPDVTKLPSAKKLVSLINESKSVNAEISELKGGLGSVFAEAEKKDNLHTAAFKLARKLYNMDAVKMLAFLVHFDDYRAKLELDKLAGDPIPGLEGEAGEAAEEGETLAEAAASSQQAVDETAASFKPN